eukprot:967316-Rhodomonas_salina.1
MSGRSRGPRSWTWCGGAASPSQRSTTRALGSYASPLSRYARPTPCPLSRYARPAPSPLSRYPPLHPTQRPVSAIQVGAASAVCGTSVAEGSVVLACVSYAVGVRTRAAALRRVRGLLGWSERTRADAVRGCCASDAVRGLTQRLASAHSTWSIASAPPPPSPTSGPILHPLFQCPFLNRVVF